MSQAETTLCTAIEAGSLEQQVVLLAESLRKFGGSRSGMPLVAVKPRSGPRISTTTRRALEKLDVNFVDRNISVEYAWWAMANKPAALSYVEQHAHTPNVTWIDGDMMVLKEPSSFAPPPGFDFIARVGEAHDVASNAHDGKEVFWEKLCEKLGLQFAQFPDIVSFPDEKPIKAYWQGGLLTYRREAFFSVVFRDVYETLLSGDIASKLAGTYHTDQVSVALAVQKQGLKCAQYDPRMNFNVNPLDRASSVKIPINDVLIMQYHGSLWPKDYEWTRRVLASLPSDRLEVLAKYAPLRPPGLLTRLSRKFYSISRAAKIADYEARVVRY
ncbi:MAG: hypothetical protein ACO1OG_00875 [Devosia sp.]